MLRYAQTVNNEKLKIVQFWCSCGMVLIRLLMFVIDLMVFVRQMFLFLFCFLYQICLFQFTLIMYYSIYFKNNFIIF